MFITLQTFLTFYERCAENFDMQIFMFIQPNYPLLRPEITSNQYET